MNTRTEDIFQNTKNRIEFFVWPNDCSGEINIQTEILENPKMKNFYGLGDSSRIEANWAAQLKTGKFAHSQILGSLWNTSIKNGKTVASYLPMEYKIYNAAIFPHSESEAVSHKLRNIIRVSSVGGIVSTKDNFFLLQKRGGKVSGGAGLIDSGAAGFCPVNKALQLDFDGAMKEKLERELGIRDKEILSLKQTALFSSLGYEFTGMISYLVKVRMNLEDIKRRINPEYVKEIIGLKEEDISNFIIEHYCVKKDLINDGCASLLSAFDFSRFEFTVKEIQSRGRKIHFGKLSDGIFYNIH